MPIHDDPDQLRARARALRRLALQIETTPAMSLETYTGPNTWQSPKAELCQSILLVNQAQVLRAADELRWHAHRFELRATDIEVDRARLGALP